MEMYQRVLELLTGYFSDRTAADVFLSRQCKFHLEKQPAQITMNDLWNLAHWVMVSGTLLVGKDKAIEMSGKIRDLRKGMGEPTASTHA